MPWFVWNVLKLQFLRWHHCHVGSCIHEVESPRLGHCHEFVLLAIPKDMLSHRVRVSMLDVRTFLLLCLQALFVPRIRTDTVKLTKRAMVLWFYHMKPCALLSFDQLTQSTWSCLPRREQNTPRSPESGAKFIFCIFLLKLAPFCIVLSRERRPRSRATALGCLKKTNFHMDHYGSNSLETEVYKVYSVYSPPWAQQHMARESADPVHGVMVKGVTGIFGL